MWHLERVTTFSSFSISLPGVNICFQFFGVDSNNFSCALKEAEDFDKKN